CWTARRALRLNVELALLAHRAARCWPELVSRGPVPRPAGLLGAIHASTAYGDCLAPLIEDGDDLDFAPLPPEHGDIVLVELDQALYERMDPAIRSPRMIKA